MGGVERKKEGKKAVKSQDKQGRSLAVDIR